MHFTPYLSSHQPGVHLFLLQLLYRHPFISFSQLSSDNLDTAHTGLFVHVHDVPLLLKDKLSFVISTGISVVCLITAHHEGLVIQPSSPPPLIIPPDSLIVHTASTWCGDGYALLTQHSKPGPAILLYLTLLT